MSPCTRVLAILLVGGCGSYKPPFIANENLRPDLAGSAGPDLAIADMRAVPNGWIRQFGSPQLDFAGGVASDATGNAYVTGSTRGGLDGNANAGENDVFLMKFDRTGRKIWTRQFGTALSEGGSGVATDGAAGNVYVTGTTWGGPDGNPNAGGADVFVVKFDDKGNRVWASQFGTPLFDGGADVATDGASNAYVVGVTDGGLDGNKNAGGTDVFVVKCDAAGNRLWTRQIGTVRDEWVRGVATDQAGNVFFAGTTAGGLEGWNAGGDDAFLAKYDTNGNKLWMRQFGTPTSDSANAVALDAAGHIYVSGETLGELDGNLNAGVVDAFVAGYDGDGARLWVRQFGTKAIDECRGVVTDAAGNVYVAGDTDGAFDGNRNAGNRDGVLVKSEANGWRLWTRQFGTSGFDLVTGVTTDGSRGVYVIGSTSGAFEGGRNAGLNDAFLAWFPTAP